MGDQTSIYHIYLNNSTEIKYILKGINTKKVNETKLKTKFCKLENK